MNKSIKKKGLKPVHIIALSYLALILAGAVLLYLPVSHHGDITFSAALFDSVSAATLTGLSVVPVSETFTTFGQTVILFLIQLGGLGVMTFTTMILMVLKKRFTLKDRLVMQQALGHNENKGIVRLTRNVTIFMLGCETVGTFALMPFFVAKEGARGVYTSLFTSVSAFCNAGLNVFNQYESLEGYSTNAPVLLIISALIILGGLGFVVVADVGKHKFKLRRCHVHTKIVVFATAILLALGTTAFFAAEHNNPATFGEMSAGHKIVNSFFQSVTCRTAGFSTIAQSDTGYPSVMASIFLMFIGGSPASAAGGIKTTSFAVIIFMLVAGLKRKSNVVVFKHTIAKKTCLTAAAAFIAALLLVFILSFVLLLTEKTALTNAGMYSLEGVIFESVSALSTCGLSFGITPFLSSAGRVILSVAMLTGKIGALTLAALFFSEQDDQSVKYPEANILIG